MSDDEAATRAREAVSAIESLVSDPASGHLLDAYYDPAGRFAASTFETLGGRDPDRVVTEDLLAVTLLDVVIRPDTLRRMLISDVEMLSDGLASIGPDAPLWLAADEQLVAAERFWNTLCLYRGVNKVIAGKLLARKRPNLIPVVDRWTERALPGAKGAVWETLRRALRANDLPTRIEALRPATAAVETSTLRLLDALVWMWHSESTNARATRETLGLPLTLR